ncbi:MAG: hypothetical protein ACTS2F_08435 [Thainema sp.]
MQNLNRDLIRIVGGGWLAFLIVGLLLSRLLAVPTATVLIDQSYCKPAQWQTVAQDYAQLYQRQQQQQLQIESVIVFSDLGQTAIAPIPTPADIQTLSTYGRPNPERQKELQAEYSNAILLKCPN